MPNQDEPRPAYNRPSAIDQLIDLANAALAASPDNKGSIYDAQNKLNVFVEDQEVDTNGATAQKLQSFLNKLASTAAKEGGQPLLSVKQKQDAPDEVAAPPRNQAAIPERPEANPPGSTLSQPAEDTAKATPGSAE